MAEVDFQSCALSERDKGQLITMHTITKIILFFILLCISDYLTLVPRAS